MIMIQNGKKEILRLKIMEFFCYAFLIVFGILL